MNRFLKSAAFPILIVILLVFVAQRLVVSSEDKAPEPTFNQFLTQIQAGQIEKVQMEPRGPRGRGHTARGRTPRSTPPATPEDYGQALTDQLETAEVPFTVKGTAGASAWCASSSPLAPFVLFMLFFLIILRTGCRAAGAR